MGTISRLSLLEISETIDCLCQMRNKLSEYSHISDHVSKGLKEKLNKEIEKFTNEEKRRWKILNQD